MKGKVSGVQVYDPRVKVLVDGLSGQSLSRILYSQIAGIMLMFMVMIFMLVMIPKLGHRFCYRINTQETKSVF